jgi:hypothetical protein
MRHLSHDAPKSRNGAALAIVLAFVVLLTALAVAYLGRTSTYRQLARGVFSETAADELVRSAINIVVGDLKQEIADGTPINSTNILPQRSPAATAGIPSIPNLVRTSIRSDAIAAPAVASKASAVNSTTDISANGRFVSAARWNSHYLVPKANTSNDDSEPVPAFVAPDWVIVSRNGMSVRTTIGSGSTALNNATSDNADYVIGRYGYAIYDEGGLLDINVAGYPSPAPNPISQAGRKGTIAFADLTALPTTGSSFVSNTAINRTIGWRNFATVQPSGTFPNFTFTSTSSSTFANYFLDKTRDFGTVSTTVAGGRTDQAFINRSQLIALRSDIGASVNMLQYLATFSRERNKPTGTITARFALAKLAQVVPSPANPAGVKTDFGLVWNSDHWEYWGANGTSEQSAISPIAGTPDFFQIIAAGRSNTSIAETLTVGASIIDQYDSDSTTTVIEYAGGPPPRRAYGMESLAIPTPSPAPAPPPGAVILNREFRNVGELGYAFKTTTTTLDFKSNNADAGLLDLFTYNTASIRPGIVNLNTRNSSVLAAIVKNALPTEASAAGVTIGQSTTAGRVIADATIAQPAMGRQDIGRLAAALTAPPFSNNEESRETIARALAEVAQTRTWGLLIDVVAQSGRYPPNAASLADFIVEGEKRYWLHIAIDRFTGEVIDQQLEEVFE